MHGRLVVLALAGCHRVFGRRDRCPAAVGTVEGGQHRRGALLLGHAPAQVETESNWVSVTAGDRHTCGVRNDGTACWGGSFDGQRGVASVWSKPCVPVLDPP
ncbi:MAG: RCC1 domain-containing protein [Kofleriaceae bacterium]|nr:RCC1 domain-containing protein [Kofleriaceae bacterium]